MTTSSFLAVFFFLAVAAAEVHFPDHTNVLARFYGDFAQVYLRPSSVPAESLGFDNDTSLDYYQFFFTVKEYSQLREESLTMLNVHVLERSVTYHPQPNFEVEGTRYFYRREAKQKEPIEIELVDRFSRLFREVNQTNRYFYLSFIEDLQHVDKLPSLPYYEVVFKCNRSYTEESSSPILSYIDRSYKWSPRYLLDLSTIHGDKPSSMFAYADVRNEGERTVVIKALELIAGDSHLIEKSESYPMRYGSEARLEWFSSGFISLGEQARGTHVYQLATPSNITLAPSAVQSVEFLQVNLAVEPFLSCSVGFSTVNDNGKLRQAYNISSLDAFLPKGHLILREQGRFLGEVNLPNLGMNETYTMIFGVDGEVSYRRFVTLIHGDPDAGSVTYRVRYTFQNFKPSRDVRMDFTESFSSYSYFQVKNITSVDRDEQSPALQLLGTDLRGQMSIPHGREEQTFSYDVTIYKSKPTITSTSDQ